MMMEQLSTMNKQMVTREFLENDHAVQTSERKQHVQETVAPVVARQDAADARFVALEREVQSLRACPAASPQIQAVIQRQQRAIDKLDPSTRSLSIIGFKDVDPKVREHVIRPSVASNFPTPQ